MCTCGTYKRNEHAVLNISCRQHPTKEQLYRNRPTISKFVHERYLRFAGHCFRSKNEMLGELNLSNPRHGRRSAGRPKVMYFDVMSCDTGLLQEDLKTALMDIVRLQDQVSFAWESCPTSKIWVWC